jgi:hypothetical protein
MSSTAPIPSLAQPYLFTGGTSANMQQQEHFSVNPPPYSQHTVALDAEIPPQGHERISWYQQREQVVRALDYEANFVPSVSFLSPRIYNFV